MPSEIAVEEYLRMARDADRYARKHHVTCETCANEVEKELFAVGPAGDVRRYDTT